MRYIDLNCLKSIVKDYDYSKADERLVFNVGSISLPFDKPTHLYKTLKRFVNKKPVYIYFIYQTMSGTVKEFVVETNYQDSLGKDLDMEYLAKILAVQDKYKTK